MKTIKFAILSIFLIIFTNSFATLPPDSQSINVELPSGYDSGTYVLHYRLCEGNFQSCKSEEHVSQRFTMENPTPEGYILYYSGTPETIVNVDYIEMFQSEGNGFYDHYIHSFQNGYGLNAGNCWNTNGNRIIIASVRGTGAFWCQQQYPFY